MAPPTSSTLSPPLPSPNRDFLLHLELYLSKRDGIDKLLKILRYTSKLLISSPTLLPPSHPLFPRLKSFESSVGLSRKAFRLGKFIQDVNSLSRAPHVTSLHLLSYGGEGVYYFIEQIVWLQKTGLLSLSGRKLGVLQKVSAWAEMVGYVGSVAMKVKEVREMSEEVRCLDGVIEVAEARGEECEEVRVKRRDKGVKIVMKKVGVVQDLADALMALADIRDGKGRLSSPVVVAVAGLVSALISTHKNWVSC